MNVDLWRRYFAAAIPAAATIERHDAKAMALRAAEIADAMMAVDLARMPAPSAPPSLPLKKPDPPRVPGGSRRG